jgi:hypothetical protein
MRGLDFVFRSEVDWDIIFPVLKLLVELTNSVEQFTVRLFRGFDRVQSLVHLASNNGKCAHEAEEVHFALAVRERDIPDVVWRIFARKLHVRVVVILNWRSPRPQTNTRTR